MRKQPRATGGLIAMLTNREREITQLVASGHSNKELSRRLGVSEGTVKVHLHHIYEKLGITGLRELKAGEYAVVNGAHPLSESSLSRA
jgi:two-component system, NarL family, nitrate/nitrite response regulator NarL